ncbi:glycerol uptake operon antiterminator [Oceanobacillus limi]|uniref:Glycerol uptake operon antiterminator regulatory protein n=1 Tax=Oceanobacillus limi TaxID=930131 RepID=A0A1I0BTK0_9BACI|nr:glycerol-3-phosphate responsive antiterminator [Oceanobacillus limi]SET10374.1 glycerol uptake operon antiterminator [Oceanobacillus limi]
MIPTGIIPAIRNMKDFDEVLETSHKAIVLLETRLAQLKDMVAYAKRKNKKVFLHFDLIQGLKADDYGMEFLIREVKPDGILSTRGKVIGLAKKHNLLAIQRLFLLDSSALDNNLTLIRKSKPDCIEVLPGIIPRMIEKVHQDSGLPIIAGGLIKEETDVTAALEAGAVAITTSDKTLW